MSIRSSSASGAKMSGNLGSDIGFGTTAFLNTLFRLPVYFLPAFRRPFLTFAPVDLVEAELHRLTQTQHFRGVLVIGHHMAQRIADDFGSIAVKAGADLELHVCFKLIGQFDPGR